jgi:hypothetical protein
MRKSSVRIVSLFALAGLALVSGGLPARAGVFTTIHFIEPGSHMVGFEPEFLLTSGTGLAGNVRITRGLTELNNISLILGTGSGPRKLRLGGNVTLDIFPDIDGQPGIGIGAQGMYYRVLANPDNASSTATTGLFEVTAIPYIHEQFDTPSGEVEPYFAFPFGATFQSGRYESISSVAVGTFFKANERVRYSLELGVGVDNAESYLSGGFVYRFQQ